MNCLIKAKLHKANMIVPIQLKKPSNWQDFEKLCNCYRVKYGRVKTLDSVSLSGSEEGHTQRNSIVYSVSR